MILPAIMGATGTWWTPKKITTALWLDAADSDTITLDGSSNVEQWDDKSGNERHVVQGSSTLRPAYVTNELNGLNTVRFDGSDDYMQVDNTVGFWRAIGHGGIFAVATNNGGKTERTLIQIDSSGELLRCAVRLRSSDSLLRGRRLNTDSNISLVNSSGVASEGGIISAIHNYSSGSVDFGVNGDYVSSNELTSGLTQDENPSGVKIGGLNNGRELQGDIAEIIAMETEISTQDRQRIEGYLAHKWGLAGNLPAEHPYKSRRPRG